MSYLPPIHVPAWWFIQPNPICMTHDAAAYAYDAQRIVSDLYVAEGLR